jgi:hypothetical protein
MNETPELETENVVCVASNDGLGTELSEVEREIMDSLNKRFQANELHPQKAALYLAEMIPSLLDTLAWKPQNVQAAIKSAKETIYHLGGV